MQKACNRCGKCCLKSPCQIPVIHIDSLRVILTQEFHKPPNIGELDIVEVVFRYQEEKLEDGRVSGFFLPLSNSRERCMWLKKEKDGKFTCTLFWNKTAEYLVGFAEQVIGKGKGCTLDETMFQRVLPMVFRDHKRAILSNTQTSP